jgi:hypothetical protein
MNTLNLLKSYAKKSSDEVVKTMDPKIIALLMAANNRVLKAAIIQNFGELVITPESLHESFDNMEHVVASSDHTGCIRLSLAAKDSIDKSKLDLLPL